jgi:hypothetical protein
MKNVTQIIKTSIMEDRSNFQTELRHALNASTDQQSLPPIDASTPPPPAAAVPRAVRNQTEENATIREGGTLRNIPLNKVGQLRAVRKSADQGKLWQILTNNQTNSEKIDHHPPEKSILEEERKENLDKIVLKMQNKKVISKNHNNQAKTQGRHGY